MLDAPPIDPLIILGYAVSIAVLVLGVIYGVYRRTQGE